MSRTNEQIISDIERARRQVILMLFIAAVALILFSALRGEQFWNKVKGEGNLWNYGSSLQYFMAGQMAVVNAFLIRYYMKYRLGQRPPAAWVPWAAAGGAFVFFACDEMLEIHEKVGEALEASVPLIGQMYPGHADNLIFGLYGLGALAFSIVFFRALASTREARAYFIAGAVMIGMAILLDLAPRGLYIDRLPFRETEELLEVFAGVSFTAAFISTGAYLASRILDPAYGIARSRNNPKAEGVRSGK